MSRFILSILFFLCSFLAQARLAEMNISAAKGFQQRVDDNTLHTGLKCATIIQTFLPRKFAYKLFNGAIPSFGEFTIHSFAIGSIIPPAFSKGYSKSYLLHIYPFLHFW